MTDDDAHLTRFLLGDLPATESSQIEERFFADNALFERICALEEELVRDFLRNKLSANNRDKFEARLRLSPELRRKTESVKAIMGGLGNEGNVAASSPLRVWSALKRLCALNGPAMMAAAAAVILAVSTVWVADQNSRLRSRVGALQAELRRNQPRPVIVSFLLMPGRTKGDSSGPQRLVVPISADFVHLHLEVADWAQFKQYRAALRAVDDQAAVWSAELKPADPKAVELEIHAAALRNEDYILALDGLSSSGDFQHLESYSFSVVRR